VNENPTPISSVISALITPMPWLLFPAGKCMSLSFFFGGMVLLLLLLLLGWV